MEAGWEQPLLKGSYSVRMRLLRREFPSPAGEFLPSRLKTGEATVQQEVAGTVETRKAVNEAHVFWS